MAKEVSNMEYQNPIIRQRADPWIYKHADGYYYFTASVPEYDRIEIRRAKTIAGLAMAEAAVIWRGHLQGIMSANVWAPEIHYIDERWYIYFAAARQEAVFDHRIYVLENSSADPLQGDWVEKGQLVTNWESFSLDATMFEHKGCKYLVWAQRDDKIPGNSNLYIAKMDTPYSISGQQVLLSSPEYEWEKAGFLVNEGPAVLKKNGKLFLTYSASATDYHYCMGMLTTGENSDLLSRDSWHKSGQPVFATSEANGQYGPGHNSFTVSEDGTQDLLVYHARNYKKITGDPLYDPYRHTRVQMVKWHNGIPCFGQPAPDEIKVI